MGRQGITFKCKRCGHHFPWRYRIAGRSAKCVCGAILAVPERPPTADGGHSSGSGLIRPMAATSVAEEIAEDEGLLDADESDALLELSAVVRPIAPDGLSDRSHHDAAVLSEHAGRLHFVGIGMLLVLAGAAGSAVAAVLLASRHTLALAGAGGTDALLTAALVVMAAGLALELTGKGFCLAVPRELAGRGAIGGSLALQLAAPACGALLWVETVPPGAVAVLALSLLAAAVLMFTAFMAALARALTGRRRSRFGAGMPLLAVLTVVPLAISKGVRYLAASKQAGADAPAFDRQTVSITLDPSTLSAIAESFAALAAAVAFGLIVAYFLLVLRVWKMLRGAMTEESAGG